MTQALTKPITVKEFLEWIPENSPKRYELHNGAVVEIEEPTGEHEEVTGFLNIEISAEIKRLKLPYSIPKTALVQSASSQSIYSPDLLLIVNKTALKLEPLWAKYSTVEYGASIPLVIEVVSTNWRDDYHKKLGEYVRVASRREQIQIPEYWIVDYLGNGGVKFIGKPKQATLSIYNLVDDEYQVAQFKGDDRIVSFAFPELNLTAKQIFQAGNQPNQS